MQAVGVFSECTGINNSNFNDCSIWLIAINLPVRPKNGSLACSIWYDKPSKLASSFEFESQQSEVSEEQNKLRKLLNMSVNEIELSVRAANCLNNANITTVGELAMKTEQEMLKYRNFGKKSLNEIKEKLEALGLSLGMKFDERLLDNKKEA